MSTDRAHYARDPQMPNSVTRCACSIGYSHDSDNHGRATALDRAADALSVVLQGACPAPGFIRRGSLMRQLAEEALRAAHTFRTGDEDGDET